MRSFPRTRYLRPLTRFRSSSEGTSAVEFALVLPIFLATVLSMFQIGQLCARIVVVDAAAADVARQVYVGNVSHGIFGVDDLKEVVCDRVQPFISDCATNLIIELVPIDSLADIPDSDAACIDSTEDIKAKVRFEPGASDQIMFLRICLLAKMMLPELAFAARTGTKDGNIRLISSISFMNEPFDD
jgi:TadE-like protein